MTSTIKAGIRIGRVTSNRGPDTFRIEISDENSLTTFFDARFTTEQFADLVTTRTVTVDATWQPARVGTTYEHKEEIVPLIGYRGAYADKAAQAAHFSPQLASYEVDGWMARMSDCTNHHRIVKSRPAFGLNGPTVYDVRVTFTRFVRPDGTPVSLPEAD